MESVGGRADPLARMQCADASASGRDLGIALVDYRKGNIRSVEKAFLSLGGVDVSVTSDAGRIKDADAIVLPGVGSYRDAAATLAELGLLDVLAAEIESGKPFLGICLGLHLLFEGGLEHSGEGSIAPGMGLIPGIVDKMPVQDASGNKYKIPHVGWNQADVVPGALSSSIFCDVGDHENFYFTHSYIAPDSEYTIATTDHSVTFTSAVRVKNAFGVQFHPEKSSDAGLLLLSSFVALAKGLRY